MEQQVSMNPWIYKIRWFIFAKCKWSDFLSFFLICRLIIDNWNIFWLITSNNTSNTFWIIRIDFKDFHCSLSIPNFSYFFCRLKKLSFPLSSEDFCQVPVTCFRSLRHICPSLYLLMPFSFTPFTLHCNASMCRRVPLSFPSHSSAIPTSICSPFPPASNCLILLQNLLFFRFIVSIFYSRQSINRSPNHYPFSPPALHPDAVLPSPPSTVPLPARFDYSLSESRLQEVRVQTLISLSQSRTKGWVHSILDGKYFFPFSPFLRHHFWKHVIWSDLYRLSARKKNHRRGSAIRF